MFRCCRVFLFALLALGSLRVSLLRAQTPPPAATTLKEVHADGLKAITEAQLADIAKLQTGAAVTREDLQAAADRLVQSGFFERVDYNFKTLSDGVVVTFHVTEAPRLPAYFDNFPWFSDSELHDAIRSKLPAYDGMLPGAGAVVDEAASALKDFVSSHGHPGPIEHASVANPLGEGNVQQFHIEGADLGIANVEFGDPALNSSRAIQQHLSDLQGKPYSRMALDLFLFEHVRPVYLRQGYLRVKLGPPEVRLTGKPEQKLPDKVPVYVPVIPGPVYHWRDVTWNGNSLLSSITLSSDIGVKPDGVADGMAVEAGWDRIREDYAARGYLDAKVDPVAAYDDQAHTVGYTVAVSEGQPYRYGNMTVTGLSVAAEKKLREEWPIAQGEVFDKAKYETFLTALETHPDSVFKGIPLHYETVGHWLQPDAAKSTVDVLLDFK